LSRRPDDPDTYKVHCAQLESDWRNSTFPEFAAALRLGGGRRREPALSRALQPVDCSAPGAAQPAPLPPDQ